MAESENSWTDCGSSSDDDKPLTIRMKWIADNAKTLDQVVEKLNDQICYIRYLQEKGYELRGPILDDHGILLKKSDNIIVLELD